MVKLILQCKRLHYTLSPKQNQMPITIKQIAKKANVSIATVSRALSGDSKVRPATKKLVLKFAKQLNYNPNIIARNFVRGKSNIIGLVLPDISDEYFSEIIRSIDDTSYLNGYYTMVMSSHENRSLTESINTMMNSGIVGGFILLIPFINSEIKKVLNSGNIPFVLISGDDNIGDFDVVTTDNYQSAFRMVEFLVKKGYKKIAHISGPPENNDAFLRKKGFRDACSKYKVEVRKSWLVNGNFTMESGELVCTKLLNEKEKPEVIFAANDMMALGCYKAIHSKGMKIPADIAIAGFDDILISEYANPALTTIRVDTDRIGKVAAERLIEKMIGTVNNVIKKKEIASELVVRSSC